MVLLEGLGPQFPLEPESTLFPCVRSVSTSVQLSSQFYLDVLDWMLIGPGADRVLRLLRLKTTTISLGSVVLRWKGSCPHSLLLLRKHMFGAWGVRGEQEQGPGRSSRGHWALTSQRVASCHDPAASSCSWFERCRSVAIPCRSLADGTLSDCKVSRRESPPGG